MLHLVAAWEGVEVPRMAPIVGECRVRLLNQETPGRGATNDHGYAAAKELSARHSRRWGIAWVRGISRHELASQDRCHR